MSRQIHTRAQLESLLGTTCLAVLPAFAGKQPAYRKPGESTRDSGAFRLISEVAPFSATAEALRYIKVAIDHLEVVAVIHRTPEGNEQRIELADIPAVVERLKASQKRTKRGDTAEPATGGPSPEDDPPG